MRISRPRNAALLAVAAVAYALLQSLVAPALLTIQHDLHTTAAGAAFPFVETGRPG